MKEGKNLVFLKSAEMINWDLAGCLICSFLVISDKKRTKETPLKEEKRSGL